MVYFYTHLPLKLAAMVLSENNEKPLRSGLKFRADHTFWELRAVRLCGMVK